MSFLDYATPEEWDRASRKSMVDHPEHYTSNKWEVIEILEEFFPKDPSLWQTGKYLLRHDKKGRPLEDLEKAAWYLNRKINQLKEQQNGR